MLTKIVTLVVLAAVTGAATIALGQLPLGRCEQSSLYERKFCSLAIDGNAKQSFADGSCSHTNIGPSEWWQASTELLAIIRQVRIYNRVDAAPERLNDFIISVDGRQCAQYRSDAFFTVETFDCNAVGHVLRIQSRKATYLMLCEVQALGEYADWNMKNTSQLPLSNCKQSSVFDSNPCEKATDGNVNQIYAAGFCSRTNEGPNEWWEAQTKQIAMVKVVRVFDQVDLAPQRVGIFVILVDGRECNVYAINPYVTTASINCNRQGRVVRIQPQKATYLTLCEVQVFGWYEKIDSTASSEWQSWSQWSSCSVTCGPATVSRIRERSCQPDQTPGLCIQPDVAMETEKRDCDNPSCPAVNGGWSHWNPWSNCLVTCGWGYRVRNRLCNNPPPSNGDSDCGSLSVGYERCLGGECPVDGHWGTWAPCSNVQGSHCATTPRGVCESGFAMYCRQCDNPKPEFGGSPCVTGLATDRRECWNTEACDNSIVQPPMKFAIIGFLNTSDLLVTWLRAPYGLPASSFFITWTITGTDSVGDADVPVVPVGAQKTVGESYEHWIRGLTRNSVLDISIATRSTAGGTLRISKPLTQSFRVSRVDGGWGEWGPYGSCSPTADCNIPGTRTRSRICDRPVPANGGITCHGSAVETSRCFHPC